MEVITKSSVDFSEASSASLNGGLSRSSTSHSVRTESQLSLECLPPEVPFYSGSGVPTQTHPDRNSFSDDQPDPPSNLSHSGTNGKRKEGSRSAEVLHDRIQEISNRLHSLTGPSHDRDSRLDREETSDSPSRFDRGLPGDVDTYGMEPSYGRENLSSRNSTLVDEEGELMSSSGEDFSSDESEVEENTSNSATDSRAMLVHSETCNSSRSAPEVGFRENLEENGRCLDSDGDSQSSDKRSDGERNGNRRYRSRTFDSSMDPKLYKALEKMKKLDERLANISKKERAVKRQRRLLEQKLSSLSDDGQISTDLVAIDDCEDSLPTSPVFVTRLEDNSSTVGGRRKRSSSDPHSSVRREEEEGKGREGDPSKKPQRESDHDKTHGTNFIKRNIELASEAGAAVSMTESEKKRLEQLLCDSNEIEDPYSGPEIAGAIEEGDGFSYSKEDLDKMRSIDSRLQLMLPPADWDSISSSPSLTTTTATATPSDLPSLADQTTVPHITSHDSDQAESLHSLETISSSTTIKNVVPGEEVLHHFQMSREESQRLKDIDARLLAIKEENERIEQAIAPLPVVDLQTLIDQCTRELQCSSLYGSNRSRTMSSRLVRADNEETDLGIGDDVI